MKVESTKENKIKKTEVVTTFCLQCPSTVHALNGTILNNEDPGSQIEKGKLKNIAQQTGN